MMSLGSQESRYLLQRAGLQMCGKIFTLVVLLNYLKINDNGTFCGIAGCRRFSER